MNGGTISGNTANSGGGIDVASNGTVIMNGGTISGNTALSGGGIFSHGTVTINGGTISENNAQRYGGGIAFNGTVTMNGGTISGNTTTDTSYGGYGGGGIYFYRGTFTMNGGIISGNTAAIKGGGILNDGEEGIITIHGGTISGNTTTEAPGGGISSYGTVIMTGGTISGNTSSNVGGGLHIAERAIFKKMPPSGGGQNSGIIYGSEAVGVDANGVPLRNTASNDPFGHAVYLSLRQRRNTTAGQTDQIDTETGRGLSANGNPPFGQ